MDYQHFKQMKQNAVNKASWNRFAFWAFSDSQFSEGCARVGAKKNRRGKWMLSSIPGGGFLDHKGSASWNTFWANWERWEKALKKTDAYIVDGLIYEYGNYEAHIGGEDSKREAESHFPEATEDQKKRAWKKFWNMCIKNNWF